MASASLRGDLTHFTAAWEQSGGTWEVFDTQAAARLALLLHLRSNDVTDLVATSLDRVPLYGLDDAIADAGFHLIPAPEIDRTREYRMGLAGVDAALANTGSLVLASDPTASWLPAILPMSLVVVVLASQVLPDLTTWRQLHRQQGDPEAAGDVLVITGPSANADLDLQERRGFYGPSRMHLILLRD